jgi:phage terminase small subunit
VQDVQGRNARSAKRTPGERKNGRGGSVTPKQYLFCAEYLVDLNASQAAIRAGYSKKGAGQTGEKLLKNAEIRKRLSELQQRRQARTEITADYVIERLAKIADFDHRQLYDSDGVMLPAHKMSDAVSAAISGIEHTDKGGVRVKVSDRVRALELLGKHLALFTDRIDASVKATGQVTIYLPDNGRDGGSDGTAIERQ